MKVTKLIREYVEEQVSKVFDAKVNPYSEQAELDRQMIKDFENQLKKQNQELLNKFVSENEILSSWDYKPYKRELDYPSLYRATTQTILNEANWKKENSELKSAKIREIMLNLELGATRHELNNMIAKLLED